MQSYVSSHTHWADTHEGRWLRSWSNRAHTELKLLLQSFEDCGQLNFSSEIIHLIAWTISFSSSVNPFRSASAVNARRTNALN